QTHQQPDHTHPCYSAPHQQPVVVPCSHLFWLRSGTEHQGLTHHCPLQQPHLPCSDWLWLRSGTEHQGLKLHCHPLQ
uniref:Uncharacterized protein n=1 Tax=Triticum urartu TaxID=4572 RepID=A0A8R7PJB2_TRIUA